MKSAIDDNSTFEGYCNFSPLKDTPTSKDELGLGFEALAQHLKGLVTQSRGGISIGLLGRWGSGKSSVIDMLTSQLNDQRSNNYAVFKYDAWIHENDHLRRAFLEALIDFLSSKTWIDSEYWKDEFEVLAGRKVKQKIEERNLLTEATILTGLVIFLIEIFHKFKLHPIWDSLSEWTYPIALLLLCMALGLLKTQDRKVIERVTTSTGDITSLEFEKFYKKLLSKTLSKKERRLVVCIDNLDRLDPDHFQQLWSTMRVFVEQFSNDSSPHSDQLWVLVPFDPGRLGRAFKLYSDSNGTNSEKNERQNAVEGFIQKTFQMVLSLPVPLSSSGHSYLKELFKAALGPDFDLLENQVESIIHYYRSTKQERGWSISPRESKLYVNNAVSYFYRWNKSINIVTIAVFIVWKENTKNWRETFYSKLPLSAELLRILPDNWYDEFLSLYFNLPAEKAKHMLLEKIIEEAITKGVSTEIGDAAKYEGFQEVFIELFMSYHAKFKKNLSHVSRSSIALTIIEKSNSELNLIPCWNELKDAVNSLDDWNTMTADLVKPLKDLFERVEANVRENTFKNVLKGISAHSLNEVRPFEFLGGLNSLLTIISDAQYSVLVTENLLLPMKLRVVDLILATESRQFDSRFIPLLSTHKVTEKVISQIGHTDKTYPFFPRVARYTKKFFPEVDLKSFAQTICPVVEKTANDNDAPYLIETLMELRGDYDFIDSSLQKFCLRSGTLDLLALRMYHTELSLFAIQFHFFPNLPKPGLRPEGKPASYFDVLEEPGKFEEVLKIIHNYAENKNLLGAWFASEEHCKQWKIMLHFARLSVLLNGFNNIPSDAKIIKLSLQDLNCSKEDFQKISTFKSLKELDLTGTTYDFKSIQLPTGIETVLYSKDFIDLETIAKLKENHPQVLFKTAVIQIDDTIPRASSIGEQESLNN